MEEYFLTTGTDGFLNVYQLKKQEGETIERVT